MKKFHTPRIRARLEARLARKLVNKRRAMLEKERLEDDANLEVLSNDRALHRLNTYLRYY